MDLEPRQAEATQTIRDHQGPNRPSWDAQASSGRLFGNWETSSGSNSCEER